VSRSSVETIVSAALRTDERPIPAGVGSGAPPPTPPPEDSPSPGSPLQSRDSVAGATSSLNCASAALRTDERQIPAGVGSGAPPPTPPPEDSPSPGSPLQSRDSVAGATSSLNCASAALRTDERQIPAGVGSGAPPPTPPPEDSPSPGSPLQSRDSVAGATSSLNCASAALRTDERQIPAGVGSGAPPPTPPPEDSPSPGSPLQSRDSVAGATSSLNYASQPLAVGPDVPS
jgi:hypothetical protein